MSGWEDAHWESDPISGVPRRDRRSGPFRRFVPDHLESYPLSIDGPLAKRAAEVERAISQLNADGAGSLAAISRFLLRSEAIASSRIEGVAPSPQQVALAELADHERVRGVSAQARLVANNMTVVRAATTRLVRADTVTVADIERLHAALLPEDPRHHGLRTVQNWIGGSEWHPIDADFVPPGPERVPVAMADLVDYLNGAVHAPLVQAAIVHAQFETIHPFTDGNGRVGRALIHTVLARRALTPTAVLPVSLVLATLRARYVDGLTHYRYDGAASSDQAVAGLRAWISLFVEACSIAVGESAVLVEQIAELRDAWVSRVAEAREAKGMRGTPRADSATARLLALLPEAPVLTVASLRRILDVSHPAAQQALDELRDAEVLDSRKIERNATAYLATEVLDLVTLAERRLASTRFDTRMSAPNRPVPHLPQPEDSPGVSSGSTA